LTPARGLLVGPGHALDSTGETIKRLSRDLCYGVSQIAAGIQLRSAGQDVRTILGRAA
jgi:hypothetical protein